MHYVILLLTLICILHSTALINNQAVGEYNVFELQGPAKINSSSTRVNHLNIFCYIGSKKSILQTWKSVKLEIFILSENFQVYRGATPDDVRTAFKEDTWMQSIFSSRAAKLFNLDPFNSSCLGVKAGEDYNIELIIENVDNSLIALLCVGLLVFLYSKTLAENKLFYYLCGISIGILASFLILIYFLSKFLPGYFQKPIIYSALAGCTIGVYILQLVWSSLKPLLFLYYEYVLWYTVIMGFVSFIICYKVGPPKDQKSKNIISWILQVCGLALIYFSTYIFEVFCGISATLIIMRIFPRSILTAIGNLWRKRFPPERVLLTEEEYIIQGQVETAKALEELRGYCSSPECKQWDVMLRLKDPKRFAKFIETSKHISADEFEEYDSSEFILRKRNLTKFKRDIINDDLISDDDSSDSSSGDNDDD